MSRIVQFMVFWIDVPASKSGGMRRSQFTPVKWLGVALVSSLSRLVAAQPTPHVEVPAECGSREAFLTEIAALQPAAATRLAVSELVITRRRDDVYTLHLVSDEGERTLTDADCRTLFKTAVVIAATMADLPPTAPETAPSGDNGETVAPIGADARSSPEAVVAPSTPQPAPTPADPADQPPVAPPPSTREQVFADSVPPSPSATPTESVVWQFGAGAAGCYGLSPDPHVGLEGVAGLTGKRWGGHVAVRVLPPRSMRINNELGLRQTVFGARLSAARFLTDWLRLSAGLSGYWISAQGLGISDPTTDAVGLLAPELEFAASLLTKPELRAEIALHGRLGLSRPRFEIDSGTLVYQLPRLGGAAVLRILWTDQ